MADTLKAHSVGVPPPRRLTGSDSAVAILVRRLHLQGRAARCYSSHCGVSVSTLPQSLRHWNACIGEPTAVQVVSATPRTEKAKLAAGWWGCPVPLGYIAGHGSIIGSNQSAHVAKSSMYIYDSL